jgi:phospholipid/cholesterol/gamma-HCH transport system permease protein
MEARDHSSSVMTAPRAELSCKPREDGALILRVAGPWRLQAELPPPKVVEEALGKSQPRRIAFDASGLGEWDSGLLAFLVDVTELCRQHKIEVEREGLPSGVQRLLALAEAVPERTGARRTEAKLSWLERVGTAALEARRPIKEALAFLGEATIAAGRCLRGRARYRNSDLLLLIQQAGSQALGIVTLISFLVGTILAFVGAVQLRQFGAEIYVADLVGIAMVREMGAMMTGIVMAGRTGAAFAAQLGTMKVTQEIDALTTMGISPLEFLVLPRMIALSLMMPLLCLYADFLGIAGGSAVGVGMLGLKPLVFFHETTRAVSLSDLAGGVFKSSVYGVLVAISGCLRGMQCGNSSSAVGDAATSAVVTGIVLIIATCGTFAVIFYVLGI